MLLIYSSHITNRLLYVLDYIFKEQYEIEYSITNNKEEFDKSTCEKLAYSSENISNGIYIYANNLLFETDVREIELNADKINGQFILFKNYENDALGFDVFAAVFFLLSRYEEYYDLPKDKFDNYNFQNSILYQESVLATPVIEQWLELLARKIQHYYPLIQFKKTSSSYLLTFDVDVAYAYRNRSFKRVIGGFGKKIIKFQVKDFIDQLLTVLHFRKDMYDTFSYISSTLKNQTAIYFFNMGKYDVWDKNPSYKNKKFRRLIQSVSRKNIAGLHPSYASNTNVQLISTEKNWLEEIIAKPVTISRQHHLKLKFPATYKLLIRNGITEDHTIGYHDLYGFRAGTCKSFLFFDLKKNEVTALRLFPFSIMEGTLNDVMKLSIDEAKKIISDLIWIVCKYDGIFIPVWHNSTLSNRDGWKGWRTIFEYMLAEIGKNKMKNFLDRHIG